MTLERDTLVGRDIVVRSSPIHGLGVYARRAYRAGEIVLRWDLARIITREEFATLSAEERRYTHPLGENRILIVQPPERYVNHSCDNNTAVCDYCDVAVRPIGAGEEITSDYSSDGSGSNFTCSCGAPNCRGTPG
jgi:SET domain-containing protein